MKSHRALRTILPGGVIRICGNEYIHSRLLNHVGKQVLVEIDYAGSDSAVVSLGKVEVCRPVSTVKPR